MFLNVRVCQMFQIKSPSAFKGGIISFFSVKLQDVEHVIISQAAAISCPHTFGHEVNIQLLCQKSFLPEFRTLKQREELSY